MNPSFIIFAILLGIMYTTYRKNDPELDDHYQLIDDYFVGQRLNLSKPFLWMHANNELNARHWESFYSRSSTKLNQPYLYITMKSIYDKCADSFNVCLVDDTVFARLIPRWTVAVEKLASPIKEHYRNLGLSTLVYYYGGMVVAPSTLCLKDMYPIYKQAPLIGPEFLCGQKNCPLVRQLMDAQTAILDDTTAQPEFLGTPSSIPPIDGIYLGTKSATNTPILLQHLLGTSPLDLHKDAYAIYIPAEELLRRPAFSWFTRMSVKQVLNSNLIITKHILASY